MRRYSWVFGFFGILGFCNAQCKVAVKVDNIKNQEGTAVIGLFQKDRWLQEPVQGHIVEIMDQQAHVVFENLAPGEYGISLYHDENRNGKLDKNALGIPKEPIAFSNNAKVRFGPPKWEDAAFEVREEHTELEVSF